MDQLGCMRAFADVVECGGFSRAAERRGTSKALVSKQVAQLESALGIRLLHRTTRRVSPTTSGQAYYERCRLLLQEFDELDASIRSTHTTPSGLLRVNAPTSFAELHLMPVVARFSERYPDITLEMSLSDRFVDLVDEGIDVAIRIADLPDSSLVARRLSEISLQLCAAPDYLEHHGVPANPEELAHHRCVLDTNYAGGTHWRIGAGEHTVAVTPALRVGSARAARELVLDGRGIGVLPSFVVADDIARGRLIELFPDLPKEHHGVFALYTHRKHLSAKVQFFIEALTEAFSG